MKHLTSSLAILVLLTAGVGTAHTRETATISGSVKVDGLSCPFCAAGLQKKVNALAWVQSTKVYIDAGRIDFKVKSGAGLDTVALRKAVRAAGFTPKSVTVVGHGTITTAGSDVFLVGKANVRLVLEPGVQRDRLLKAYKAGKNTVHVIGTATTKNNQTHIAIASYRVS